jgi:capsular exopolysaccharide synthesis family protein
MIKEPKLNQTVTKGNEIDVEMINIKKLLNNLISHWILFFVCICLSVISAFLYIKLTIPTYRISASLLINENEKTLSQGNDNIFDEIRLIGGSKNIDNQLKILTSRTLVEKALGELSFYLEFYKKGMFSQLALYPDPPIEIVMEQSSKLPVEVEFKFKYLDNDKFSISGKLMNSKKLKVTSKFGEVIEFPGFSFKIEKNPDYVLNDKPYKCIYFKLHDAAKISDKYLKRIMATPGTKQGTIIDLTLDGTNETKEITFLNRLIEIFINSSLERKNQEAIRTIEFIDDQLTGISDSLMITENKLQDFRSKHRVMDLSSQGQVIIDQAMKLENEKARIEIESNYYNYLAEYLRKDNKGEAPIAPATMGITDPGLTRLVLDLSELQAQLYSKNFGDKNPLQNQLNLRIKNTKEALQETLIGVMRANNLARDENLSQIRSINEQATALPVTERQLLGIERKFKLNDELYTFLLEKRAIAQIQKASNIPDTEIIDYPKSMVNPVRPRKPLTIMLALLAGITIPFVWIIGINKIDKKICTEEEITNLTSIPIIAHIPHSEFTNKNIVIDDSSPNCAEAFRSLRFKMQFLTKDAKSPLILVTSCFQNEGKTFTSVNLASVYSILGKKTILLGFDLRKPKLHSEFDINNNIGISTWLIGKSELDEIIQFTNIPNLHVIASGPVPPNPSELLWMEKVGVLIQSLRDKYDIIIADTSPIGTVSDAMNLTKVCDTIIIVVRNNITHIDHLGKTIKDLTEATDKGISIVYNDIDFFKEIYRTNNKYLI